MKNTRLVWLNIETGEFSKSWKEEDYPISVIDLAKKYSPNNSWKLIEYTCLNDEDFRFNNLMTIK